jgi:hypothetical protein
VLEEAIASYRKRERRFGRTSEQLQGAVKLATDLATAVPPAPTLSNDA